METPFIKKVKKILDDPQNLEIISWSQDKTMIQIRNQKNFQQKVLSRHFRHSRISSFIRQLNLYGFKKIRSAEHRTFTHPMLEKGFGLQAIINKKKKITKSEEEIELVESIHIEATNLKVTSQQNANLMKEMGSQHRNPQNLILNRQNQKLQKIAVSTSSAFPSSDSCMNTFWVVPFNQAMWRSPFFSTSEPMYINMNYNSYQNWC